MIELIFQKEFILIKQMHQRNVIFVIIGIFRYRFQVRTISLERLS